MVLNQKLKNWRYERKFFVSGLSKHEIEAVVKRHPALFSELYYERNINNIYFDTFDMMNYFQNIDGLSRRIKFRIRWYGDLLGKIENPVLEVKIKNGQLGSKLHYPLESFCLDELQSNYKMQALIESSEVPEEIKTIMKDYNYTLLNRYTRKYYESADRKFRITIDSGMKYINLSLLRNTYLTELNDCESIILELKYDKEDDEHARMITNYFPFRMTKSSKYVTGIDVLHHSFL